MAVVEQDNFSNVSWQSDLGESGPGPSSRAVDPMDDTHNGMPGEPGLRGEEIGAHALGSEQLDCTVTSPIKENDGTKDAFVSYLITTEVSFASGLHHLGAPNLETEPPTRQRPS